MIFSDVIQAAQNLRAQKLRTFLTALGIVFGVGSVIGMLAIGAGAREESLSFIEQLGVRNVLVDSRQAATEEELQERRRASPGLTERDVRILEANIESLEMLSPRRSLRPARVLPKPAREVPDIYGVRPAYATIHNLNTAEGSFFSDKHNASAAPVCVLGQNVKVDLFGYEPAVGKYLKVNDSWLEVVGVLGETVKTSGQSRGGRMENLNNVIYVPFSTFQYRFWDMSSYLKDEIEGVDLRLKTGADSIEVAKVVTAILNSTHNNTQDFTVTIPAALLAQQQRTQTIFTYVMVAIAAISLLVGGIGIMNIVLATVLERTPRRGRPPDGHRAPVPHRVRAHLHQRGGAGHRLWLFPGLADLAHSGVEDDCDHNVGGYRLRRLGGRGYDLRHLPRHESLAHQPDRSPALRVGLQICILNA